MTKYSGLPYRGSFEIRDEMPSVKTFRNVVFMPRDNESSALNDPNWGLYATDGTLIEEAAYRRGYSQTLVGQSASASFENLEVETAADENFLYGGHLTAHFGHFLMGTIGRLWIGLDEDLSNYKIVCHGIQTPEIWFAQGFIRDIFQALGISQANFVNFDRPTRIPQIKVPGAACEEEHFGHAVYATWGHRIGESLLRGTTRREEKTPIFLTKTNVKTLVHGAINEDELVAALIEEGVKIVHPEKLTIAEQVMMWRDRTHILGSAGSALHSSFLWPPGTRIGACSVRQRVHPNCGIIDKVNGNRISYTFPAMEPLGKYVTDKVNMSACFRFLDPKAAAKGILHAAGL
jgi:hypothetical protein